MEKSIISRVSRGNLALFLTDVLTLNSDPIGQTLGMAELGCLAEAHA